LDQINYLFMPLSLHLLIHFTLAILTGYLAGAHFKKIELGVLVGFLGGFLIDLDHVLEYLLVYSLNFNLIYFLQGRQFLISDQIHLWFHAWEYMPILLLLALVFKKKKTLETIFVTLAFAMSVHLLTDSVINKYPLKFYSLLNRTEVNFSAQKLMRPDDYQKNQETKIELGL